MSRSAAFASLPRLGPLRFGSWFGEACWLSGGLPEGRAARERRLATWARTQPVAARIGWLCLGWREAAGRRRACQSGGQFSALGVCDSAECARILMSCLGCECKCFARRQLCLLAQGSLLYLPARRFLLLATQAATDVAKYALASDRAGLRAAKSLPAREHFGRSSRKVKNLSA